MSIFVQVNGTRIDADMWSEKKRTYVAFEINDKRYLFTCNCAFNAKGIQKETFMEVLDQSLFNRESLVTIIKKVDGKDYAMIIGDEERQDCKNFKKTIASGDVIDIFYA